MKTRPLVISLVCAVLFPLVACDASLTLTVLFERVDGLKAGDPVVWEGNRIGQVAEVRYTSEARFEVKAQVAENYREAVTERSRFVVSPAPGGAGKALEMLRPSEGGAPLQDGAVVQGTTRGQVLGESLETQLKGLLDNLRTLPRDWAGTLGEEMDRLAEELGRAGGEARERLREEVLPELERRLEDLRKWLRERGREDEAEPLDRRLEKLKGV